MLLSPDTLAKLERLDFAGRRLLHGPTHGERRGARRGRSVEFADYRNYVQGDDLRFVDWNIAARLDRYFVKLFLEEEDLRVSLLVDASPSMSFGEPTKLLAAQRLVAALGFIGLVRGHRVSVGTLGDEARGASRVWRGRHAAQALFAAIESFPATERTSLLEGARRFQLRRTRREVVVLVSDLLDKSGYEPALRALTSRQGDVTVVHLLSREELHPEATGELKLIDAEDEEAVEITAGPELLAAYERTLQAFLRDAREFCRRRGLGYLAIDNVTPVEQVVAGALRGGGLVRS